MKDPELLARSGAFYETLVGSLTIGLYSCDVRGSIVFFNKTAVELLGHKPGSEKKFWPFHKAWFPDGTPVVPEKSPMALAIRNGTPHHGVEMWVERPDGSQYYAGVDIDLIRDEEGNVAGGVGTIRDATDAAASAKTFVEREVRYRQLVKSLPVPAYVCDEHGYITMYNDAATALWGREPEPSDRWSGSWKIYSGEGIPIPHEDCPTARCLKERHTIDPGVVCIARPDGTRAWTVWHVNPIFDGMGRIDGAVSMLIDITEERKSRRILEDSIKRLLLAVDAAELGTWECDLTTMKIVVSERHRQILAFTGDAFSSREAYLACVHPDDRARVAGEFDVAKASGKLFYETRIIRRDGTTRWIRVNGTTLYDDGVAVRILGTLQDITSQREASEDLEKTVAMRTKQLRRLNKQLEKSNHELEQFAYIASHDLQEPLRKIQTFATLVENVDNEAARRKYLVKVREEAQGMSALVRDVLMFSRLSTIPEFDHVDLNQVVEDVRAELSLVIADRAATLRVGQLPAVRGIPRQLTQLVSNIVHNSLKFAVGPPVITVDARKPSPEEMRTHSRLRGDRQYVVLTIQDNGIGFDQKYSEQIFKIFQRLNPREAYPGNGIGLALCKKIVENHHGVISARSAPGNGTTISIILPGL